MKLDETEFTLFCIEISKVASKYGVNSDVISSILAEAIKNRENSISKTQISTVKMERERQPIYGPPPVYKTVEVNLGEQPIYGPPSMRR